MNELKDDDEKAPTGDHELGRAATDLLAGGVWHAPHGRKTRAAAWVILAALAVCLLAMLVAVAMLVFGWK